MEDRVWRNGIGIAVLVTTMFWFGGNPVESWKAKNNRDRRAEIKRAEGNYGELERLREAGYRESGAD